MADAAMNDERNVIIVGAGFSKPFGLPLSRELFGQVINFFHKEPEVIKKFAGIETADLETNIKRSFNLLFPNRKYQDLIDGNIPFEEFLTEFTSYQEIRKVVLGKNIAEDSKAEWLDVLYGQLLRAVCIFLDRRSTQAKEQNNKFEILMRFCKRWGKETSHFISFNYDLVLERGLFEGTGGANRDHNCPLDPPVFKPHGSIDVWNMGQNLPSFSDGYEKLEFFNDTSQDCVCRLKTIENRMISSDPGNYAAGTQIPMIVPPTYYKAYSSNYITSQIKGTLAAIVQSTCVYVIGFSFNEYDRQIRSLFNYALIRRKQDYGLPPPNVVLVDPTPEAPAKAIASIFGKEPEINEMRWEEWLDKKEKSLI